MILDPFYLQVSNFKTTSGGAGAEVVPPVSPIDEDVSLWVPFKWGRFVPIPRMKRYIYPLPIKPIEPIDIDLTPPTSGSRRIYWIQKKRHVEPQPSPIPPAMPKNEETPKNKETPTGSRTRNDTTHNAITGGGVVILPTPFMIPYKEIKPFLKKIIKAIKRRKHLIEDYLRNLYSDSTTSGNSPAHSRITVPYNFLYEIKEKPIKIYKIETM